MKLILPFLAALLVIGWLLIPSKTPSTIEASGSVKPGLFQAASQDASSDSAIQLTRTPIVPQSQIPNANVWERFEADLADLYKSEDGRALRYKQQNQNVDELLRRKERLPVDGLDSMLLRADTLVPIESLDSYQSVGLSEMEFIRNRISAHFGVLLRWRGRLLGSEISAEGKVPDASSIQAKIKISPVDYPPEVIFFAFSKSKKWPSRDKEFIAALARSRDLGLLNTAASWMDYTAISNTAGWMATFPKYREYDFRLEDLKELPLLKTAFNAYEEAEQRYLFLILGDMDAYGYL